MAPAPTAKTVSALPMEDSSPSGSSRGAIIAAVVIMETVDDPCADFNMAATIKGRIIPTLREDKLEPITLPMRNA
ncbi:unnamed protein product [marine sediment metagenome]|uniref:Uncharacterized protein n=1 Tax=marine sediment metagenome TaxID=412755 RepID=X1EPA8_9ZZZZ